MMGVPTRMVPRTPYCSHHSRASVASSSSSSFVLSLCGRQLICTMVAGFTIVNYTNAGKQFHEAIDSFSGPIYLLFFLYTGVSMDVAVLARNLPACLLIFVTRASLIVLSTYLGGSASQQPEEFRCRYWMGFLTQAGVTLGLAKDASAHFSWGPDFNATIVAVSVINQIVGPPLMKMALRGAGEAYHNYVPGKHEGGVVGSIGAIGKANMPLTGRPQARGALVIAADALAGEAFLGAPLSAQPAAAAAASEASVVVGRLRARGWEVLLADEKLKTTATATSQRQRMDQRSSILINRLPAQVRNEVSDWLDNAAKPWERVQHTRSLPNLAVLNSGSRRGSSGRSLIGQGEGPSLDQMLGGAAGVGGGGGAGGGGGGGGGGAGGKVGQGGEEHPAALSRESSGEFGSDYVHRLPHLPSHAGGRAAEVAALIGGLDHPLRQTADLAADLHSPAAVTTDGGGRPQRPRRARRPRSEGVAAAAQRRPAYRPAWAE